MKALFEPVRELAGYDKIEKTLKKPGSSIMISGCIDSQKAHLLSAIANQSSKNMLIIANDETRARMIYDNIHFYNHNVCYYPAKDFIFYTADVHGNQLVKERLAVVSKICSNQTNIVITTIDGCADYLMPIEMYKENTLSWNEGDCLDVEAFKSKMIELGYDRQGQVDAPGQFAIRGGIIDVYTLTDDAPIRIELFDDEIDSIRYFDVESQRSIDRIDSITIFPATEMILDKNAVGAGISTLKQQLKEQMALFAKQKDSDKDNSAYEAIRRLKDIELQLKYPEELDYEKYVTAFMKNNVSFVDYFDKDDTVICLDEPNRLKERMDFVEYEFSDSMTNRLNSGYILPCQSNVIYDTAQIYAKFAAWPVVALSTLEYKPMLMNITEHIRLETKSINSYNNRFEFLAEDLQRYKKNGYRVVLVSNSRTRANRLAADLKEYQLNAYFSEDFDKAVDKGCIMVTYGNIHKGFEYPLIGFVVIAESDIFGQEKKQKAKRKQYEGKAIASFNDLSIGDYVVHENHGLGIYRGIEKVTVDRIEKDYIKIEYSNNGNLYILATQLDMLQKYANSEAKAPKLNKLGSQEWNKTKDKVHGAVEEVAKDLVELYAKRQNERGHSFGPDTVWQTEFEEMFPYDETQDQLSAIEDTKRDMESTKIMDRLICGDVGYGKTEIAIRAAFKAVQDGKQVAYLVPTTILAQQHYNTFEQRMTNYPVNVELLSRFKTAKQVKEIKEGLKKGSIDIVVGTHKILSKDIQFKDLGLLIIDEEQRFGVTHKEKIKKMKENIDVLTLSATPIPRTLHMSLVGIRDMSVLEEPPVDRLPIQTFVTEHNDEMIREAINREIGRNGQVYYVYNKVKNIDEVAMHVAQLVPEANVAFAHGQMDEKTLENIMYEFINGEIDVLVSTTIIETGLDISNVNTIIIEDSDKFGLSQLYQLRGRVGRSNRTAYAFLLYKRDRMLKEAAEKRLHAIREFTDLGSGFKIAMRDLEIRGAGNVLGQRQHGHMAAVGYDLYCKMLNEAVNSLKGIKNQNPFETCVDLNVDAYIPSTYIKSEYQKLDVYKRIAGIENKDELMDMQDELMDRFGDLPKSAINLLKIAMIKSKAHRCGIIEIKGGLDSAVLPAVWRITIRMYGKADIDAGRIPALLELHKDVLKFKVEKEPLFTLTIQKKYAKDADALLEQLSDILDDFEVMLSYDRNEEI